VKHKIPIYQYILGLLVLLATLTLLACGAAAAPGADAPDAGAPDPTQQSANAPVAAAGERVLRVGTPFSLSPPAPPEARFTPIKFGMGETLFRLDHSLQLQPWLATHARAIDDLTWEITLRPGVSFHNGRPMDAQAVKASLERNLARSAGAGVRAALDIASIDVQDPLTLTITTNQPNPIVPALLTEPQVAIVDAAAAQEMGDAFAEMPVLTGPFKVERYRDGQELVIVRHEDYWGELPQVDRLIFVALPDISSRMLAFQSGDIDIAEYISPESTPMIDALPNLSAVSAEPGTLVFMMLNHQREPWNDLRVRQAVSLAIDRDALLSAIIQGQGVAARGPFPPILLNCQGLPQHSSNLDAARQLLAQAGFQDQGGSGYLSRDGRPITMTLLTYRQRQELPPMAEIIQSRLREIGIRVEIRMVEQIGAALDQGDWDGAMYFNNMVATGEPYGIMVQFFVTGGPANYGGFSNPQVDGLVQQMGRAPERLEREQLACAASQILVDELAIVPLVHPDYTWGISQHVVGFEPHPFQMYAIDHNIGRR
jgi:peptide/nickel transport system substrate-binding protein